NPMNAHHPSRLVVQILPNGLKPEERPRDADTIDEINRRLSAIPEAQQLMVVSIKWTHNGNCVLFTRADQSAAELLKLPQAFEDVVAPGHRIKAGQDTKWLKIQVDGVPTGAFDRIPTIYDQETIHEEFKVKNPTYAGLKITQFPRWMRAREEIARQPKSSVVFAVENTEQAESLLREVKVMTYYQRRDDFTVTLRSDLAKDPDIQVMEVAQRGAPTVTFVNIYNDTTQRESAADRIRTIAVPRDEPAVYSGDTNLHHEEWSCEDKRSNAKSRRFLQWMMEDDQGPQATLLNEKGEITYTPHDATKASSVIDLTFVNAATAAADTIKDWAIDPSMSYGSDHYGIRWVLDHGRREIENTAGIQYSLKEVKQEDWASAFSKALETERTDIDPMMDEGSPITDGQLDAAAEAITRAMQRATAEVGK
ncbi:hypothetical protein C8R45DRAFT_787973, partial [Mycena sanguinolenta]